MKKLFYLVCVCIVVGVVAVGKLFYFTGHSVQEAKVLHIPKGVGLIRTAYLLKKDGLIGSPKIFMWGTMAHGQEKHIKAGEYSIQANTPYTPYKLMKMLVEGDHIEHRFTLIEGDTVHDALTTLRADEKLTGDIAETPEEGSLFPDTYFYQRGEERADIIAMMKQEMRKKLEQAWSARDSDLLLKTPREALILASIVEKEVGCNEDPARIAAVFLNRLKIGMRLQSCPTVIYGMTQGKGDLGRPLTLNDLKHESIYNTYTFKGLPPTPICNPSLKSIKAVMNPLKTNELYFVADGKGGHHFSATYKEHQKYKKSWRFLRDVYNNKNLCTKRK